VYHNIVSGDMSCGETVAKMKRDHIIDINAFKLTRSGPKEEGGPSTRSGTGAHWDAAAIWEIKKGENTVKVTGSLLLVSKNCPILAMEDQNWEQHSWEA
jgi:hypothetical protein